MGSLTKTIAPALSGGKDSGGQDFLHMLMGSRAAGENGYHPLAGLVGGIASLAGGRPPQTGSSLQELFRQMGMSPIGSDPPGTPPFQGGMLGKMLNGMQPPSGGPSINPQLPSPGGATMMPFQTAPPSGGGDQMMPFQSGPPPVIKSGQPILSGGGLSKLFNRTF